MCDVINYKVSCSSIASNYFNNVVILFIYLFMIDKSQKNPPFNQKNDTNNDPRLLAAKYAEVPLNILDKTKEGLLI